MRRFPGVMASEGSIRSKAKKINDETDFARVNKGDIILVRRSSPGWIVPLLQSEGIICEVGGIFSHLAIICRELGKPCITNVNGIFDIIEDGADIMIDGNRKEVIWYDHE